MAAERPRKGLGKTWEMGIEVQAGRGSQEQ